MSWRRVPTYLPTYLPNRPIIVRFASGEVKISQCRTELSDEASEDGWINSGPRTPGEGAPEDAVRREEKQVILYGTQIGGEATDASAIDLLVLVDESLDPFDVRTRLGDVLFDILIDAGELISVIVIPEQLFNTYNSPFLLTVKKEGVVA